ncbi:hypothetical protein [Nocardioides speluncae]|uniref:hypothetical protein n=1 Tax=Nocardioides speluncae TaxID=2670337 RepID=UPI000D69516D|nr:hypothetical protein [Nocardioides speluncae]
MKPSVLAVPAALLLVAAGTATATSSPADQGPDHRYRVSILDALSGPRAFGAAINSRGLVAGASTTDNGKLHATIWRHGEPVDLGTLGGPDASSAVLWPGTNDAGAVVGVTQTDDVDPNDEPWSCGAFLPARIGYACVGFVWRHGEMRALPTLGGTHGFATDVNNRGQIVGWAENQVEDPDCNPESGQVLQFRAVRWDHYGRRTTELPPLAGDGVSSATAINDDGRVVGISGICDQAVGRLSARNPVVWDHGKPRLLPDLGGLAWDTPMAINERGDAVGFANRSAADGQSFRPLPVLWTADGKLHKLALPDGYAFGQALGINKRREVVGVALSPDFTKCTAMLWRDGKMVVLQDEVRPTSLDLCNANHINNRGQITGEATDRDSGKVVGFVLRP